MRIWIVITLSLVILFGGAIVYWAFFQREHHAWSEVVMLWNGKTLPIQQHRSHQAYHFAAGHGYLWGGGDPWQKTTFIWKSKDYCWESPYIPIAIQPYQDNVVYIVVFDRETQDYNRPNRFRLYQSITPSTWKEIDTKEFPKPLAIQNTWLHLKDDEIVLKMDTSCFEFRESLTVKLWNYIEHPYRFNFNETPTEEFARQFKEKWIQTYAISNPYRIENDQSK